MEGFGLASCDPVIPSQELPGRVLHVGCGGSSLPDWLGNPVETRLDISPEYSPNIVASITDLGDIGEYDAVYCSHCLEHIHGHEVTLALAEFYRVLRPGGYVLIFVPDLEDVHPTDEVLFISPAGPITGMDLIHGKQDLLERIPYMVHKTGFTNSILTAKLECAGFDPIAVSRVSSFNLFGIAIKS